MERTEADTVKFTPKVLHKALLSSSKKQPSPRFILEGQFARRWDVDLMIQFPNINKRCVANNIPCTYEGGEGVGSTDRHTSHENVTEGI